MPATPKKETQAASVLPAEGLLKTALSEIVGKIIEDGKLEDITVKDTLRMAEVKFDLEKGLLSDRSKGHKDVCYFFFFLFSPVFSQFSKK